MTFDDREVALEPMLIVPGPIVETDWLEANLDDLNLRVYDCTVLRDCDQDPDEHPMRFVSGKGRWLEGHVPGSGFIDLVEELTVKGETRFMFPVPPPERFSEAMSAYGIGPDSAVILYDTTGQSWAARVWWMLRAQGFDNAAVLNGGWRKWKDEERPISIADPTYQHGRFVSSPREALTATRGEVLASLDSTGTCLVNTLSREDFEGSAPPRYGRRGAIPSSVNVPITELFDKETGSYLTVAEIKERFGVVGVLEGRRVVTY